jgi:glycine/sarcosine N-methyltransferase
MPSEFYKKIAPYFDLLYPSDKPSSWIDFIIWAFGEFARVEVRKVLDCGCGTGAQSVPLLKAGYEVTATDLSPDMLDIARRKFKENGFDIRTDVQDVRSLPFDNEFDGSIFMFSAFNHLLTPEEPLQALNSMKRSVVNGGAVIFDVFNALNIIENYKKTITDHFSVEGRNIIRHITHKIDSVNCFLTHDEMCMIHADDFSDSYSAVTELRIFTRMELDVLIRQAGFSDVRFFRSFADRGEETGNTIRLIYVCIK